MKNLRGLAKSPWRDTLPELASTRVAPLLAFPVPLAFQTAIPYALPAPQIPRRLPVPLPAKSVGVNDAISTVCDSALLARQSGRARFSVNCLGGIHECRETPLGKLPACSRLRRLNPRACRKEG